MKLAFCLFRYFPHGGLQRDFIRIGQACLARGHRLQVFAAEWEGEVPAGFEVNLLPWRGISNHARCRHFIDQVLPRLRTERFDAVIGFNKMPGLDLYYAADTCFFTRARERHGAFFRLTPRYRHFVGWERAVFADSPTEILLIAPGEKKRFQAAYGTPDDRFHLLPPGISPDRRRPQNAAEIAAMVRNELGIGVEEKIVLMVGSAFRTKGLDRSLRALAALPDAIRRRTRLLVIGRGEAAKFEGLARRLKVDGQLTLLGGRDDVPRFLLAADLLLHPARTENTGTVLLEALAAGLPVLATDVCGYGFHVAAANAGMLVSSPFRQAELDRALSVMLAADARAWQENALAYVSRTDIFSLPAKAAEIIERVAARRGADA